MIPILLPCANISAPVEPYSYDILNSGTIATFKRKLKTCFFRSRTFSNHYESKQYNIPLLLFSGTAEQGGRGHVLPPSPIFVMF